MQACTLDGTTYDIVNIVEYIRKVRHPRAHVRCGDEGNELSAHLPHSTGHALTT